MSVFLSKLCYNILFRFLARECGLAGKSSLEMAQVDEVVDVVQDALTAVVSIEKFIVIS